MNNLEQSTIEEALDEVLAEAMDSRNMVLAEVKEEPLVELEEQAGGSEHKDLAGSRTIEFPSDAIVGSVGEYARTMAQGNEVPEVFYFASALTMLGAICGDRLRLNLPFLAEPRLYTVLLGESYRVKKSTALKHTLDFFSKLQVASQPTVSYGVASAEGLVRCL